MGASSVRSVSPHFLGVSLLPRSADGWSELVCLVASLKHSSALLSSSGESSPLPSGVLWRADPVDARVASNSSVGWIDKDYFVELVAGVLSHPVGVENTEVAALAANTFLSDRLVGSGLLDLSQTTRVSWLSVNTSLLDWSFTSSSTNADSVNDIALLSLVAKFTGFVWAGWSLSLVDDTKLSVFPGSDSEHKSDKIRLFLPPNFFQVLVSSHLY